MHADSDLFEVERAQKERLRNKYSEFRTDVIEFRSGSNKIQIQVRIAEEFLRVSEDELKVRFDKLCTVFLAACEKYNIPVRQSDILILTDEEIDRGLQIELKSDRNGSLMGLVFIPASDLCSPHLFWKYTFLHELGHCWIDIRHPDLETEEIFTDLVAILALKSIARPHTRMFKDTIRLRSYTGGPQGMQYFGPDRHMEVLNNPELYVTKLLTLSTKRRH